MYALNILNVGNALLFKEDGQLAQCERMPLNSFRAMILALVIKDVFVDRCTKRTLYAASELLLACDCDAD